MKIVVAHPHRLICDALSGTLAGEEDFEVYPAYEAAEISRTTARYRPEVVVIGAAFVDSSSDSPFRDIKAVDPSIAILVVSGGTGSDDFMWVLKSGASGYVALETGASQLVDAIRKVQLGEVVVCGVDRKAFASQEIGTPESEGAERVRSLSTLTPREREVLALLAKGFSNRQIANDLYLSEHTIRTHVQNLRTKLNVRSKFEAAVLAMQAGGRTSVSTGMMRL